MSNDKFPRLFDKRRALIDQAVRETTDWLDRRAVIRCDSSDYGSFIERCAGCDRIFRAIRHRFILLSASYERKCQ